MSRPVLRQSARLVLASAVIGSLAVSIAVAPPTSAAGSTVHDSQLVSGNSFMTNGIVEVGSRPNGSFGTNVDAPAGYHPLTNRDNHLGFRSDRDQDGWGVGTDDGDFFQPGTPYEGWAIQVGDAGTPNWNSHNSDTIAGAYADATSTGTDNTVTWTSTGSTDGVAVKQVDSVPADAQYLNIEVTLTNTTGGPLTDLYYARAVDPDNCRMRTDPVCDSDGNGVADTTGTYKTFNTIVKQETAGDSSVRVSADQTDGSYFDLRTTATNAIGATAAPTGDFCKAPNLQGFYGATPAVTETDDPADGPYNCDMTTTKGDRVFKDDVFYVLVKTPTLAAGASRTFRLQYFLSQAAASATLPVLPPTLAGGSTRHRYHHSVAVSPGTTPVEYSVTAGTLPPGLSLDAATGAVTGRPTKVGRFPFTVKASNVAGTDSQTYTVTIKGPPSKPRHLHATGRYRAIKVGFVTPKVRGGAPILRYQASTDGGRHWHKVAVTRRGGRLHALVEGLQASHRYPVAVRAVNRFGPGASAQTSVVTGWFHDVVSPRDRAAEVTVPADPKAYVGPFASTTATNRTHGGRIAVPLSAVHGRRLIPGEAVTLTGDSLFGFDSAVLTAAARRLLSTLVGSLRDDKAITCEGYTDYAGDRAHEMMLSRERARAVCGYLSRHGAKSKASGATVNKRVVGYGPDRPVVVGGTPEGRAENRRVVILVTR